MYVDDSYHKSANLVETYIWDQTAKFNSRQIFRLYGIIIINLFPPKSLSVTDGHHRSVPAEVKTEAEQFAKDALKESDSEED